MKRQNVRTLSLIVATFTYLLFGATVFEKLESENETNNSKNFTSIKSEIIRKFNMTDEEFEDIQKKIIFNKPYGTTTQWKFAGSFYFATTVITTIGYGHSTPKTISGKYFCMAYAMPGIPLCIIMFQSIGERMNTFITWLLRRLKLLCGKKDRKVSQTHLILISSSLGILVLTCGAYVFKTYETWNYQDSFYYCFITLTTIGFGDFVALQRNNTMMKNPKYVAFSLIFILFGLTVVSSVMNLLVLRFLTMNTEDERRDELEAAAQALDLQRLHGDVIFAVEDREGQSIRHRNFDSVREKPNQMKIETVLNETNEDDVSTKKKPGSCLGLKKFITHLIEFFEYIPIFLGWKNDPKKDARRGYSYSSAHVICLNDSKGNQNGYVFPDDSANNYRSIRPAYIYEDDNYEKCYKFIRDHHSQAMPIDENYHRESSNIPFLQDSNNSNHNHLMKMNSEQNSFLVNYPMSRDCYTSNKSTIPVPHHTEEEDAQINFTCGHCGQNQDTISLSQTSTISTISQASVSRGHKKRASV